MFPSPSESPPPQLSEGDRITLAGWQELYLKSRNEDSRARLAGQYRMVLDMTLPSRPLRDRAKVEG